MAFPYPLRRDGRKRLRSLDRSTDAMSEGSETLLRYAEVSGLGFEAKRDRGMRRELAKAPIILRQSAFISRAATAHDPSIGNKASDRPISARLGVRSARPGMASGPLTQARSCPRLPVPRPSILRIRMANPRPPADNLKAPEVLPLVPEAKTPGRRRLRPSVPAGCHANAPAVTLPRAGRRPPRRRWRRSCRCRRYRSPRG